MTQEALKKMYQLLLTEPHAPTVCAQLERIAREALAEHAMRETQRLGQEIEQEPVAHWSDCAVHSEPAYPKSECDCGGIVAVADYTALSDKYVALSDKYVALKAQRTEPVTDEIASILACRNMLDAQPVPPRTWVGSGDIENSNAYLTPPQRTEPPQKKVWTFWDLSGGDITDAIKAKIKEKNQ